MKRIAAATGLESAASALICLSTDFGLRKWHPIRALNGTNDILVNDADWNCSAKDWVIVRSEGIPAHEDLPKTASGNRKHCSVM